MMVVVVVALFNVRVISGGDQELVFFGACRYESLEARYEENGVIIVFN